jgi:hypothetical protein
MNVSAVNIRTAIPEHVRKHQQEEIDRFRGAGAMTSPVPLDMVSVIVFGTVDKLAMSPKEMLPYAINGRGPLSQNIAAMLPELIGNDARATSNHSCLF